MELKNLKTQDLQGLIQEQLKLYIIEKAVIHFPRSMN